MKIGFVLLSSSTTPIPSTRVAVINILPHLRAAGIDARIVFDPAAPREIPGDELDLDADRLADEGYDLICFQKVRGPRVVALAAALAARGVRTLYVVCDLVDVDMASVVDGVVVVTAFLRSLYPLALQSKTFVIHDGIERPDERKRIARDDAGTSRRPLDAVLVTSAVLDRLPILRMPPPWLRVSVVGDYPQRTGVRYWQAAVRRQPGWARKIEVARFAWSSRIRQIPWDANDVYRRLVAADIAIIPIEGEGASAPGDVVPSWKVKSENRLTLTMAIGLPVVATPIPAYLPVVDQGENAFLASTTDDWARALDALRDPALRRTMGERARASVIERFSIAEQVRLWLALLARFDRGRLVS